MSYLNNQYELRLATEADAQGILSIYECGDFEGKISVLYTRRPNPYLSLLKEGEQVIMLVIKDQEADLICAVGCCVIRKAFIDGQIRRTGYLTGLKILPQYRKKIPYIARVYKFLYEQTRDLVDCYYTTILMENYSVQKMLEKKRVHMPVYDCKGTYTVYCFRTGKRVAQKSYELEQGNVDQMKTFHVKYAKQWALFPAELNFEEFEKESIYTLKDSTGEIIASCILWNQQDYKQYIVTGYQGIYKYLQHMSLKVFGYPNLPKNQRVANYASYHMLCVKDNNQEVADYFIKKIAEKESQYDFLMLGLFQKHPFVPILENMKHIKYNSKFYEVCWERSEGLLNEAVLHIDVGLL